MLTSVIRKTPDPHGVYYYIEHVNDADYPIEEWEHDPDTSLVTDVNQLYWKWDGENVVEMSDSEKLAVNQSLNNDPVDLDAVSYTHLTLPTTPYV